MDALIKEKVDNWLNGNYDEATKRKSENCKMKILPIW